MLLLLIYSTRNSLEKVILTMAVLLFFLPGVESWKRAGLDVLLSK